MRPIHDSYLTVSVQKLTINDALNLFWWLVVLAEKQRRSGELFTDAVDSCASESGRFTSSSSTFAVYEV